MTRDLHSPLVRCRVFSINPTKNKKNEQYLTFFALRTRILFGKKGTRRLFPESKPEGRATSAPNTKGYAHFRAELTPGTFGCAVLAHSVAELLRIDIKAFIWEEGLKAARLLPNPEH